MEVAEDDVDDDDDDDDDDDEEVDEEVDLIWSSDNAADLIPAKP